MPSLFRFNLSSVAFHGPPALTVNSLTVSLIFPGQGAQNLGMGVALAERSSIARDIYAEANQILGFDLLELCTSGPPEQLNKTEFCQPALFVHSLAALKTLESERPDLWDGVAFVAGLSLGEYTAVAAAGGVTFGEGLRLVQVRGKAMQAAADSVQSGMSSVLGVTEEQLAEICKQASQEGSAVRVANLLCPGNIAISGELEALGRAEKLSEAAGAMKVIRLQVAGAFHTDLMQPAVQALQEALSEVNFQPTTVPVISNVDASPHSQPDEFRELLAKQVISPVRWEASLRSMMEAGVEQFVEIGTGRVLAGTLKRINRKIPCENFGDS